MTELKMIHEQEVLGKEFKIYGNVKEPLFLAKDVANWIEHSNVSTMMKKIDEDEKGVNIVYTLGGPQEIWCLTENGLYEVLMQSRKPIAREFKKEVKQILKQIRLTGAYIPIVQEETNEEFLARAFLLAQKTLEEKDVLIAQKEQQLIEQKPDVEFAKTIKSSEGSLTMEEFSKITYKELKIGKNKLYKLLRVNKILRDNKKENNLPYQSYIDRGYFEVEEIPTFNAFEGKNIIQYKTRVTPKGQSWLVEKINILKTKKEND